MILWCVCACVNAFVCVFPVIFYLRFIICSVSFVFVVVVDYGFDCFLKKERKKAQRVGWIRS